MSTKYRLRWILLGIVGLLLIISGSSSKDNGVRGDNFVYAGVVVVIVAIGGAWWHSRLLRAQEDEGEDGS